MRSSAGDAACRWQWPSAYATKFNRISISCSWRVAWRRVGSVGGPADTGPQQPKEKRLLLRCRRARAVSRVSGLSETPWAGRATEGPISGHYDDSPVYAGYPHETVIPPLAYHVCMWNSKNNFTSFWQNFSTLSEWKTTQSGRSGIARARLVGVRNHRCAASSRSTRPLNGHAVTLLTLLGCGPRPQPAATARRPPELAVRGRSCFG